MRKVGLPTSIRWTTFALPTKLWQLLKMSFRKSEENFLIFPTGSPKSLEIYERSLKRKKPSWRWFVDLKVEYSHSVLSCGPLIECFLAHLARVLGTWQAKNGSVCWRHLIRSVNWPFHWFNTYACVRSMGNVWTRFPGCYVSANLNTLLHLQFFCCWNDSANLWTFPYSRLVSLWKRSNQRWVSLI